MTERNQPMNSRQNSPENRTLSKVTAGESSVCFLMRTPSHLFETLTDASFIQGRRRGKICRFLAKVTKKISVSRQGFCVSWNKAHAIVQKHSKNSRSRDPVLPNVDSEGASLIPDVKVANFVVYAFSR